MACAGVPPKQCRSEGTPSLGEAPDAGAGAFCLLLRSSKVSRCKSETISGRERSNGYVPQTPRHIPHPDFADMGWGMLNIDITPYLGKTEKLNLTLPDYVIQQIDRFVREHNIKNRPPFLTDAALKAASEGRPSGVKPVGAAAHPSGSKLPRHRGCGLPNSCIT
ncbi:hypothetical protein CLA18_12495 [Pseudomonas protegens]|nr:hypothetical protein CLA18_12495 [Pseudomonas protegens]